VSLAKFNSCTAGKFGAILQVLASLANMAKVE
jgi:hypothetical protein